MLCPMVRPNSRSGRALQTVGHVNARSYARAVVPPFRVCGRHPAQPHERTRRLIDRATKRSGWWIESEGTKSSTMQCSRDPLLPVIGEYSGSATCRAKWRRRLACWLHCASTAHGRRVRTTGRLHPPAGREPTQRHAPPAEVGVDTIPEFVGEIERLRAVLWAR